MSPSIHEVSEEVHREYIERWNEGLLEPCSHLEGVTMMNSYGEVWHIYFKERVEHVPTERILPDVFDIP